jgi:hypothetical protein
MNPARLLAVVSVIFTQGQSQSIGVLLRPGTQLVYSSGGVEAVWTIDTVSRDTTLAGRPGCFRMRLRTSPTQSVPDTRAHCADSTMMLSWDDRTAQLRPSRPLRAGMVLELPYRGGGSVRFETGLPKVERIGAISIDVIPTTITTRDSTGRLVRRLRERFAVGLATATGGVFEDPDASAPGGWKTTRSFELIAIRTP